MKAIWNKKYPQNVVMLVFLKLKMNRYGEYIFHGKMLRRFEKHYTKRQLGHFSRLCNKEIHN